jgi:hypothetical protein
MSFNAWITVVLTCTIIVCVLVILFAVASAEASGRTRS